MSRRDAREKAFMLLYQMEMRKDDEEAQLEAFVELYDVAGADRQYMTILVRGVRNNRDLLDARFVPLLKRWSKDRLPKIDLVILRVALYEMIFNSDVPHNVAISEAVLLCRKYTGDESRSYINAVLGRISQDMAGKADDPAEEILDKQAPAAEPEVPPEPAGKPTAPETLLKSGDAV